jgi:uncharacterized glyoxalase superfamily protein PhnB
MTVKPVPEGYPTVSPYLIVANIADQIEFLQRAFDAEEIERLPAPDGGIMHAEVRIGDSVVLMGESNENNPPVPCMLYLYLDNADAAYQRAISAGASSLQEPQDTFYGDRTAGVRDAFGNQWWLATQVEEVSREEMIKRAAAQPR